MATVLPAYTDTPYPILQAMLVARHEDDGGVLEVFSVPRAVQPHFYDWLGEHEPNMYKLLSSTGFQMLGSKSKLSKIAEEYHIFCRSQITEEIETGCGLKRDRKNDNYLYQNVGWEKVPLKTNSVVMWVGPHMVNKCTHKNGKRSVQYLSLLSEPPLYSLPDSVYDEKLGPSTWQGKIPSLHHELHYIQQDDLHDYGHNKSTVIPEDRRFFCGTPGDETTPFLTDVQDHINQHGWVVIEEVLPTSDIVKVEQNILDSLRRYLFVDRPNGDKDKLMRYFSLSNDELYERLYSEINDERYFQSKSRNIHFGKNRQGVDGVTKQSGMYNLYGMNTSFLPAVGRKIESALGRRVYFGKERGCIRGYMSDILPPHIDSPCTTKSSEKNVKLS